MNVERLEELVRVLREVEADNKLFDMGDWFRGDPDDCGTAACAIGWACRDPWMQAQGLGTKVVSGFLTPAFAGKTGFFAVSEFFFPCFDDDAAFDLFASANYYAYATRPIVAADVIGRVEALLAAHAEGG